MGLARDLVELEARLRERGEVDPFLPLTQGGLTDSPECADAAARVGKANAGDSILALRLCLQALRIQHELLVPQLVDAELVATLPRGTPGLVRATEQVVREMLARANTEVIVLGYELTDPVTVQMLGDAATRGADVVVICDRARGAAERIRAAWPAGVRLPRVFHDRERSDGAPYASMHAKCLLVDSEDLLVTSANFTFHGLHGNIEIGLRISGTPSAEARKIFSYLVEVGLVEAIG